MPEQRPHLRRVSGGEDLVHISAEAMERYREHRIVEMEAARIKKLTGQVIALLREGEEHAVESVNARGISGARETSAIGGGDFDSIERLEGAAENLLWLFGVAGARH
jgi:hypothetical protein